MANSFSKSSLEITEHTVLTSDDEIVIIPRMIYTF